MSVRLTVMDQMAQVAREQGKTLAPLNDDLALLDSGLDSLSIAVLVARLEDRLGIDPFSAAEEAVFPGAAAVGRLAFYRFRDDGSRGDENIEPIYLRTPQYKTVAT